MLVDAVAAELYKLLRNRGTWFWGFCALPLIVLTWYLGMDSYIKLRLHLRIAAEIDQQILYTLALGGSFLQIFYVAAASSLFGGEYRWETWRLLTPRNRRVNLLLAKFLVYVLGCAVSLALLALVAGLHVLYDVALGSVLPKLSMATLEHRAPIAYLATLGELTVLGAVVALVAVATRSTVAALIAGIVCSFAQGIAIASLHAWDAPVRDFALLPSLCAYFLRAWGSQLPIAPGLVAVPHRALAAALILGAWIVLAGGAALLWFQRQGLPRE